ncbi:MAG: thiamine-phosphate kinase [Thermoplasmata archaeon]|nr:thiamine-phosphate kinase [Thermoplasmata archaeon]MCI4342101.1 thiamine-phosphate kinase [Thermoplasmata archaeon]
MLPLGDDAAALRGPRSGAMLLTTDGFVEGAHFLPDSPPRLVGRALVGANASDLAAKGGRPVAFLLGLFLPPGTPREWGRQVVRGVRDGLARTGGTLVGGDSKPSPRKLLVGTFLGATTSTHLAPHTGVRPGDLLVLTGRVGGPGWVTRQKAKTRAHGQHPERELLRITPRLAEGERLIRHAHAMIDTSDGVAEAGRILSEASRCQLTFQEELLPLDPRLRRAMLTRAERLQLAVYGGEYELLAAVPPASLPALRRAFAQLGTPLTVVGQARRGRGAWFKREGHSRPAPRSRWQPWRPSPSR